MNLTSLTSTKDLTIAASLGAFSLGAMMSLATAQECRIDPSKAELIDFCVHPGGKLEQVAVEAKPPPLPIEAGVVEKFDGPEHVITIDKDGVIKCGHLKLPHRPKPNGVPECVEAPEPSSVHIHPPSDFKPDNGIISVRAEGMPVTKELNPAFTTDLYQQLRKDEGNVFFSPYSITEAMGMVHAGAGGNTAKEIVKAMSLGNPDLVNARLQNLREHLAAKLDKGDNKLSIANALCVTGEPPLQSYQDIVRKQFGGELFSGGLKEINAWASKKTDGNIDKILEKLSPDSGCVLLNAVYFKGNWKASFNPKQTHKADFQLLPGETVKVDMMTREGSYKVLRDKGLIALELPYQTSASMVLIMPDKADGMAALEKRLNEQLLAEVTRGLQQGRDQEVQLYMPKFKIKTSYDLVDPMKQLGIRDAFDMGKSDFKSMYGKSAVEIGQIQHKATLEVDEIGSVATAVTAVEMQLESARLVPEVRFDRPFLVLIRDRETGANLFMGRINDPSAE